MLTILFTKLHVSSPTKKRKMTAESEEEMKGDEETSEDLDQIAGERRVSCGCVITCSSSSFFCHFTLLESLLHWFVESFDVSSPKRIWSILEINFFWFFKESHDESSDGEGWRFNHIKTWD